MLDRTSSGLSHVFQNIMLLVISVATLPITTLVVAASRLLYTQPKAKVIPQPRRTILITGVNMTKGLALARHFHLAGHRVIGADFSPLACGRWSRAIDAFYVPAKPSEKLGATQYIADLLRIVRKESVHLWVSCSGVASAVQDGEAMEAIEKSTPCKCVQFDVHWTETLHEKHNFIEHIRSLGLTVPETRVVKERQEAIDFLATRKEDTSKGSPKKSYILKPIGMDDSSRGDIKTLLPRPTSEETGRHVQLLNITPTNPFILQQFISGREYCTHALVVRGNVKVFCACPSSDMLMHYEALPDDSPLTKAMLDFTKKVANDGGESFTGHLSFDFLVEADDVERCERPGEKVSALPTLYPIECNPRAHTAVALFRNLTEGMVDAYLSLLDADTVRSGASDIVTPLHPAPKVFWTGHDLVTRLCLPIWSAIRGKSGLYDMRRDLVDFADHVLTWQDGTFETWDPVPLWLLYHVFWPAQFLHAALTGGRWSRVNVSTGKVFGC